MSGESRGVEQPSFFVERDDGRVVVRKEILELFLKEKKENIRERKVGVVEGNEEGFFSDDDPWDDEESFNQLSPDEEMEERLETVKDFFMQTNEDICFIAENLEALISNPEDKEPLSKIAIGKLFDQMYFNIQGFLKVWSYSPHKASKEKIDILKNKGPLVGEMFVMNNYYCLDTVRSCLVSIATQGIEEQDPFKKAVVYEYLYNLASQISSAREYLGE